MTEPLAERPNHHKKLHLLCVRAGELKIARTLFLLATKSRLAPPSFQTARRRLNRDTFSNSEIDSESQAACHFIILTKEALWSRAVKGVTTWKMPLRRVCTAAQIQYLDQI